MAGGATRGRLVGPHPLAWRDAMAVALRTPREEHADRREDRHRHDRGDPRPWEGARRRVLRFGHHAAHVGQVGEEAVRFLEVLLGTAVAAGGKVLEACVPRGVGSTGFVELDAAALQELAYRC